MKLIQKNSTTVKIQGKPYCRAYKEVLDLLNELFKGTVYEIDPSKNAKGDWYVFNEHRLPHTEQFNKNLEFFISRPSVDIQLAPWGLTFFCFWEKGDKTGVDIHHYRFEDKRDCQEVIRLLRKEVMIKNHCNKLGMPYKVVYRGNKKD